MTHSAIAYMLGTLSVMVTLAAQNSGEVYRHGPDYFKASTSHTNDFGQRDYQHPRQLVTGVTKSKDGSLRAEGLTVTYPGDTGFVKKYHLDGGGGILNFYVGYPPLRQGDVIPAFGRLYRVSVVVPRRFDKHHTLLCDWVGEKPAINDVKLNGESFQVPLGSRLASCFANVSMHKVRIDKIFYSETAKSLVTDIRVDLATAERGSARLKVGSLLLLAQNAHEVLAIVPRDEKTGVIGWVEFAAGPLDDAAIKAKGWADRVVRPITP